MFYIKKTRFENQRDYFTVEFGHDENSERACQNDRRGQVKDMGENYLVFLQKKILNLLMQSGILNFP
jgi:hypothetical protein